MEFSFMRELNSLIREQEIINNSILFEIKYIYFNIILVQKQPIRTFKHKRF